MKPNVELTQKLHTESRKMFPAVSASTPAMITVESASQVCQDWFDEQRFEPLGDNHHNAMACPHCRQENVLIAIPLSLAQKFINTTGPWTMDDEKKMNEAIKVALEYN